MEKYNVTRLNGSSDRRSCRLLFFGNMMVEKGILVLLEACKLLKERNHKFTCDFVGGWTDITPEEFNQQVQEYGLSEVVFVHGPKYNAEKEAFFKNSDIFVFPTYYHYETFGLVNLEAMQFGLPIISTPEGGIPDAVIDGETGFLVPPKNAEALADKLELLICNRDLRLQMGLAGKNRFPQYFTLDRFESNMNTILRETVRRKYDFKNN